MYPTLGVGGRADADAGESQTWLSVLGLSARRRLALDGLNLCQDIPSGAPRNEHNSTEDKPSRD